jgi:hypothetical protein
MAAKGLSLDHAGLWALLFNVLREWRLGGGWYVSGSGRRRIQPLRHTSPGRA